VPYGDPARKPEFHEARSDGAADLLGEFVRESGGRFEDSAREVQRLCPAQGLGSSKQRRQICSVGAPDRLWISRENRLLKIREGVPTDCIVLVVPSYRHTRLALTASLGNTRMTLTLRESDSLAVPGFEVAKNDDCSEYAEYRCGRTTLSEQSSTLMVGSIADAWGPAGLCRCYSGSRGLCVFFCEERRRRG
jgi:hypothetical protein